MTDARRCRHCANGTPGGFRGDCATPSPPGNAGGGLLNIRPGKAACVGAEQTRPFQTPTPFTGSYVEHLLDGLNRVFRAGMASEGGPRGEPRAARRRSRHVRHFRLPLADIWQAASNGRSAGMFASGGNRRGQDAKPESTDMFEDRKDFRQAPACERTVLGADR